jgi:uncharacterized protein YdcH (DUF465 family)
MMSLLQEVRERLLAGDAEFRHLAEEHSRYEAQLEQLSKSPYLSTEDILLEATLKKKKLRVKDEMEKLIAQRTKSAQTTH